MTGAATSTTHSPDRISAVALAAAIGAGLACALPPEMPRHASWLALPAAGIAAALLAAGAITASRRARAAFLLMAIAAGLLMFAHALLRLHGQQPEIAHEGANATATPIGLLRMRGIVRDQPQPVRRPLDLLAPEWSTPPRVRFQLDAREIVGACGTIQPHTGRWTIFVTIEQEPPSEWRPGAEVEITGRLLPAPRAMHPGTCERAIRRRAMRTAGAIMVPHPDLVTLRAPPQRTALATRARTFVSSIARRGLLRGLRDPAEDAGTSIVTALLLGRTEAGGADAVDAMRRLGLAHLLAISGLHVGLVTGGALLLVRSLIGPSRLDGWAMLGILCLCLLIVEPRIPVLRAVLMNAVIAIGLVASRRWSIRGMLSASAIVLLAIRPEQITTPGFQLSFGVVLALVHFADPMVTRWCPMGRPPRRSLRGMTASTLAASTVAWLVALPIGVWHFGIISPAGIPLSIIGLPVIALLLILGALKMLFGALSILLPWSLASNLIDTALGISLTLLANATVAVVTHLDALPGTSFTIHPPHGLWVMIALGWILLRLHGLSWPQPIRVRFIDLALIITLLVPMDRGHAPLRIDALAVGDGSCYIIRSGGETLIFDAGSAGIPDAGRRIVRPALRALGVRRIDSLVISHADHDHYSAVPEILSALPVRRILLPPHMLERAEEKAGTAFQLVEELRRHRIPIELVHEGWQAALGAAEIHVLHPALSDHFMSDNDDSLVLRITLPPSAHGPGGRVLLTADVERPAIERLLARVDDLRADILELPHHGSAQPGSEALVDAVSPRVIIQSTGPRRLRHDVWAKRLGPERLRLVTARDGSVAVEMDASGRIRVRRFGRGGPDSLP